MRKIIAQYVEFYFRRFYITDVPLYNVEFARSLCRWSVDPRHPGPEYLAEFWAEAEFNGRLYEVKCFIPVHSFEEAENMPDSMLERTEWEQDPDFLGWTAEIKNLFYRWKTYRFGHRLYTPRDIL